MKDLSDTPEGRELVALLKIYVWRELPEMAAGNEEGAILLDGDVREMLGSYVN